MSSLPTTEKPTNNAFEYDVSTKWPCDRACETHNGWATGKREHDMWGTDWAIGKRQHEMWAADWYADMRNQRLNAEEREQLNRYDRQIEREFDAFSRNEYMRERTNESRVRGQKRRLARSDGVEPAVKKARL